MAEDGEPRVYGFDVLYECGNWLSSRRAGSTAVVAHGTWRLDSCRSEIRLASLKAHDVTESQRYRYD